MHGAFQKTKNWGYVEVDAHLCELAEKGDIEALVKADLDDSQQQLLYSMALGAGHVKILQKLSADTKNLLLVTNAYNGNINNVRALLKHHEFMHSDSVLEAFHLAAREGYLLITQDLLNTFTKVISTEEMRTALRQAIQNNKPKIVKLLLNSNHGSELLTTLYHEEISNFSSLILPATTQLDDEKLVEPITNDAPNIVFNLTGYERFYNQQSNRHDQQGGMLSLDADTPIGYVAYLPKQVKAVCIKIYGGGGDPFLPNMTDLNVNYLCRQGIAVIELNLVDLLKLENYQLEMPRDLHLEIQESIHHAFETFKHAPLSLHPNLAKLNEKPFFLLGESFGGAMVVKHAQMYPATFDGYISFNGVLSIIKSFATQKFERAEPGQGVLDAQAWLCPTFFLDQLQDPLLVLQNFDDNNVTFPVTADFMKQAKKAGKEHFVRLLVTEHGSPVEADDLMNTGHAYPINKVAFERIVATEASFMLDGPSFSPAVSQWRAHKYQTYSHQDNPIASLDDKFVAMAFKLYQERPERKVTVDRISPRDIVSNNMSRREKAWQYYYEPIYRVLYYIDSLRNNPNEWIQYLRAPKTRSWLLDKQAVDKAWSDHIIGFVNYVKQRYQLDSLDSSILLQDKSLQDSFKDILLHPNNIDKDTYLSLLSVLLLAKPILLQNKSKSLLGKPIEQAQISKAHERLAKEIHTYKKNVRAIWKEAARKGKDLKTEPVRDVDFASLDYYQIDKMFHDAAFKGNLALIKLMLHYPNLPIDHGTIEYAFSSAVIANNKSIAMYLFNIGPEAIKSRARLSALKSAADKQNDELLSFLMNLYGKGLKRFELIQAIGPTRAKAFLDDTRAAKKWPTVVVDTQEVPQENQQPNPKKKPRPLPLTPQKQLQHKNLATNTDIKRPTPIRPKGK